MDAIIVLGLEFVSNSKGDKCNSLLRVIFSFREMLIDVCARNVFRNVRKAIVAWLMVNKYLATKSNSLFVIEYARWYAIFITWYCLHE